MIKDVIKICRIVDGQFISFRQVEDSRFNLRYILCDTTFPKIGLLFAYSPEKIELVQSQYKFKRYKPSYQNVALWCEADVSDKRQMCTPTAPGLFYDFWMSHNIDTEYQRNLWPDTYLCRWIRPHTIIGYYHAEQD